MAVARIDRDAVVPDSDAEFAAWLAGRAGDLLVELREQLGFGDPAALREAGDRRSHELLAASFAQWRPDDAVLSEEGVDDPARLASDRVWIVDPLDGTREYGEPGRTDWAVHVALWQRGRGLTDGAVALPAEQLVLSTAQQPAQQTAQQPVLGTAAGSEPSAAQLPAPRRPDAPIRIATSRTRPPGFLPRLAPRLGAELVPMGSAGAKVTAVVRGTVDAYVHAGGQYEWDSAAPVAVALATGHHASRLDGNILEYNRPDPRLPDLVVCRPDLTTRLLAVLADELSRET